ncbi:MAG: type VI secretion system-associated protein TagO [Alphaproteobacteria bacterium]
MAALLVGASTPAAAWLKQEEISKVDGTGRVYFIRDTSDIVQDRFGRKIVPSIVIGCERGESRAYVNWAMMMDGYEGQTITYRLDDEKPKRRWTSRSEDYQATGYWGASAIGFVRELVGKKKIFIRAKAYNAGDIEVEFAIDGLAEAVEPIVKLCKWPVPAEEAAAARRAAVERTAAERRARETGNCGELMRRWPAAYPPERLRALGCR